MGRLLMGGAALSALRASLVAAVADVPDEDLADAQAALRGADVKFLQRSVAASSRPPVIRLINVEAALEIAMMPRRRLFKLAKQRDVTWAHTIGRKLLIEESAFRRWLAERGRAPQTTMKSARNGAKRQAKPRRRGPHGRFVPRAAPGALAVSGKLVS